MASSTSRIMKFCIEKLSMPTMTTLRQDTVYGLPPMNSLAKITVGLAWIKLLPDTLATVTPVQGLNLYNIPLIVS